MPIHVPLLFALFTSGAAQSQTPTCNVSTRQSIRDTYEPLSSPLSHHASKYLLHSNDSSHSIMRAVCYCRHPTVKNTDLLITLHRPSPSLHPLEVSLDAVLVTPGRRVATATARG